MSLQNIENSSLIKNASLINGRWLVTDQFFDVINPTTETVIARISEVSSLQIEQAISSASDALSIWQAFSDQDRRKCLLRWQELLIENLDDLAQIITLEQGKPLQEAKGEIQHAANYVKLYAELAEDLTKPCKVPSDNNQSALVYRRPVGVVSAITPWNFPCSMVLRKAAAALAAGCTLVLKPSEMTPLTAIAIAQLSVDAGVPSGVFNLIIGSDSQMIGEILTGHPKIAKLSFTGSTNVGKKLLQQCAAGVKRTSMELGGNAPFIVFEDADIELAVAGAMASKFRNAGQTCVSANRFLIQETVAEKFKLKLLQQISKLKSGCGFDSTVQMGPVISPIAINKMKKLITDAQSEGAELLVGGKQIDGKGYFFEPTILDKVTSSMDLFYQEIFGPIVSIIQFKTEDQAIELANKTQLGLAGYLFTKDPTRIERFSRQIQLGMLGINEARLSNHHAPFGGVKQSGMGREGGRYGIEEYLDYQYICQTKTPA